MLARQKRRKGGRKKEKGKMEKEKGSSPAVGGGNRKQKCRVVPIHHYKM
tara:strand:- start:339 stop:485 length:147 start_codon:yes stop_codon:yes gene_type:complete